MSGRSWIVLSGCACACAVGDYAGGGAGSSASFGTSAAAEASDTDTGTGSEAEETAAPDTSTDGTESGAGDDTDSSSTTDGEGSTSTGSTDETTSTDETGTTGVDCPDGFADCNGDADDACEADLTLPEHCGACDKSCTLDGQTQLGCEAGTCRGTVVLAAVEDAHADALAVNTAFGAAPELLVDGDPIAYRTYVQPIDLGPIPAQAAVEAASLRLRCFDSGDQVLVRVVTEAWDEDTLTWANRPATGGADVAMFAAASGVVTVDLTAVAQGWVDGDPLHGVELRTSGSNGSDYRSREYGMAADRPRFELLVSF